MEDYQINRIYMEHANPYSWQEKIMDQVAVCEGDGVTIMAPKSAGKTYFCREIINQHLEALNPGANILYFSPNDTSCDRMAVSCALIQKGQMTGDYSIVNDKQQAVMIPSSLEQLKKMLSSAMRFNVIVIDDADALSNAIIHSIVLKAMIDNSNLILVGTTHDEDEAQLNKSIWKWLLNHPCYSAYEVVEPDTISDSKNISDYFSSIEKLICTLRRDIPVSFHGTHTRMAHVA